MCQKEGPLYADSLPTFESEPEGPRGFQIIDNRLPAHAHGAQ